MDARPIKPGATPKPDDTGLRRSTVAPSKSVPLLAPPQQPDELGRLGPYRVLGELGRGGMGTVYRAEDPTLRRQVALKVMSPHLAADPQAKARFVREAQAQAGVEHDHVVPIFHIGSAGGLPFIAMPLLKGRTLADALAGGPRPPLAEVLRIGREMAEGLAAAHAVGLIHRDIKPANIWLEEPRGRVKILDFGLARMSDEGDAADVPLPAGGTDARLTVAGAIVGTPAYMSPEQAKGEAVDHRTDLWGLGVVLYELATGERPFGGPSRAVVLYAVARTEPPAPSATADVPPVLCALIRQLLAKNPNRRPATASAVAAALAEIERTPPAPPRVVEYAAPVAVVEAVKTQEPDDVFTPSRATRRAARPRPRRRARKSGWGSLLMRGGALAAVGLVAVVLGYSMLKSRPKPAPDPKPAVSATPQPRPAPRPAPAPEPKLAPEPQTPPPGAGVKENVPTAATDEKLAAQSLHARAMLVVWTAEGGLPYIRLGQPLPDGPVLVAGIYFQSEPLPAGYTRDVFIPAVSRLKLLTHIMMENEQIALTAEDLRVMGDAPFAKKLMVMQARVVLSPAAIDELKRFPNLTTLRGWWIGGDERVVARLAELPQLKNLTLTGPGVTATGVEQLGKQLPECQITWSDGVVGPAKK